MEEHRWAFKVFSADGRIGRLQFAYVFFLCVVGFAVCSAGLALCRLTFLTAAAYLAVCVMLFWAYTVAVIKRFHDLDRPGSDFFFTLIPMFNIYIFIKLLFFRSKPEAGEYWKRQSNAHYWMVPLFVLLIPAIFFGIGAGYQASKETRVIPFKTYHHYSEEYKYSIDTAQGIYYNLIPASTDEKPYSEYTEEDFAKLPETYGTAEAYVVKAIFKIDDYNKDDDYIISGIVDAFSDYTYRLEEINGKKFMHLIIARRNSYITHWVIGIYDSTEYRFLFSLWTDDDLLTRYYIEKAIQSIRVGEDAIP